MSGVAPLFGYAAGTATVISFIPQVVRAFKLRRTDELSWGMIVLLLVSGSLWITYGVLSSQLPVILTNVGAVSVAVCLAVAKHRFH